MANDLSGTSAWTTSGRMPLPPPTAYTNRDGPTVMAAGSKIVKGFPASMTAQRGLMLAPPTSARATFAQQFSAKPQTAAASAADERELCHQVRLLRARTAAAHGDRPTQVP